MLSSIKNSIPKIHQEGYFFIIIFLIVTFAFFIFSKILGFFGLFLTIWCVFFFRDPDRVTPEQDNIIISPADGVVQKIEEAKLPKEIANDKNITHRISIFLNVFNVHVNRIPVTGIIKKLHYNHGKFFNASFNKASEYNERQSVLLELKNSSQIGLVQIAGLIARRIICNLKESQYVSIGQRFGIIKFGSRVDVYLPTHFKIKVLEGQTIVGGETIIAELKSDSNIKKYDNKC